MAETRSRQWSPWYLGRSSSSPVAWLWLLSRPQRGNFIWCWELRYFCLCFVFFKEYSFNRFKELLGSFLTYCTIFINLPAEVFTIQHHHRLVFISAQTVQGAIQLLHTPSLQLFEIRIDVASATAGSFARLGGPQGPAFQQPSHTPTLRAS